MLEETALALPLQAPGSSHRHQATLARAKAFAAIDSTLAGEAP